MTDVVTVPVRWYRYDQNNSGGYMHHFPEDGIGEEVWIQATDAASADARARRIGLYFDGIDSGDDCECCGDRWVAASNYSYNSRSELPELITTFEGGPGYAHYLDGRVEVIPAKSFWDR